MENLNGAIIDAIVAFFNLFSEKLSLEECKTLLHTRYLLHTVAHFVHTGHLLYQDHDNFGFHETLEFLKAQVDESWTNALRPDLAEDDNCMEIAKILMILIYSVRSTWPDDMGKFVNELSDGPNMELANIIKRLDDQEFQCTPKSSSELLMSILTQRSQIQSCLDSNDSTTTLTDKIASPLAHFPRNFEDSQSTFVTAKSFLSRDDTFQGDSSSPINAVLYSPRGTNVTKLKKQQRIINELRENLESFGRERDYFEELSCQRKEELEQANTRIAALECRVSSLRVDSEQLKSVEEEHTNLQAEYSDLVAKLRAMEIERVEFLVLTRQSNFEKKEALERLDCIAAQNTALNEEVQSLRTKFRDEIQMHNFTREKLTKVVREMNDSDVSFQRQVRKLEEQLEKLNTHFRQQIQQKDDEICKEMEFSSRIRDNYIHKIKLLEKELLKSCSKNSIDILKKLLKSVENDGFETTEPSQRCGLPAKDDQLCESRSLCELAQQKAQIENEIETDSQALVLKIQNTCRAKINELEMQLNERSNMIFELCSQNKSLKMLIMQNQYLSNRRGPIVINKNSDMKILDSDCYLPCISSADLQCIRRFGAGGDAVEPIIEEPADTSLNFSALADGDVRIEVAEEVDEADIESLAPDEGVPKRKRGIGSKFICGGIFVLSMAMAVLFGAYAFLLTAQNVFSDINAKNSTENTTKNKKANYRNN